MAVDTIIFTSVASETSVLMPKALRYNYSILFTVSCVEIRSASATLAPSRARATAVAAPKPIAGLDTKVFIHED